MKKKLVTTQRLFDKNLLNEKKAEQYKFNHHDTDNPNSNPDQFSDIQSFYSDVVSEDQEIVRELLKSGVLNLLSEQEYKVFHLIFREGYSRQKAGKHLEISENTVKGYLNRITKKLQDIFKEEMHYQYG